MKARVVLIFGRVSVMPFFVGQTLVVIEVRARFGYLIRY